MRLTVSIGNFRTASPIIALRCQFDVVHWENKCRCTVQCQDVSIEIGDQCGESKVSKPLILKLLLKLPSVDEDNVIEKAWSRVINDRTIIDRRALLINWHRRLGLPINSIANHRSASPDPIIGDDQANLIIDSKGSDQTFVDSDTTRYKPCPGEAFHWNVWSTNRWCLAAEQWQGSNSHHESQVTIAWLNQVDSKHNLSLDTLPV